MVLVINALCTFLHVIGLASPVLLFPRKRDVEMTCTHSRMYNTAPLWNARYIGLWWNGYVHSPPSPK